MTDTPNSPPCDHSPAIDASAAVHAIMDALHQIEDQGHSQDEAMAAIVIMLCTLADLDLDQVVSVIGRIPAVDTDREGIH